MNTTQTAYFYGNGDAELELFAFGPKRGTQEIEDAISELQDAGNGDEDWSDWKVSSRTRIA